MRGLLLVAVLIIAIDAAPLALNPDQVNMAVEAVQSAEADLNGMVDLEHQEEANMKNVENAVERANPKYPNYEHKEEVDIVAHDVLRQVKEAKAEESSQQNQAVDAMTKLESVIYPEVGRSGGPQSQQPELGELQNDPIAEAFATIKQVDTSLHEGAKTMNTYHRIERMESEAVHLLESPSTQMDEIGGKGGKGQARLGETGAITGLLQAQKAQQAPMQQASDGGKGGALSKLHQVQVSTSTNLKIQELDHLLKQEAEVNMAEHSDTTGIISLIQKLD